jgi:zinc finger protein DZIP1
METLSSRMMRKGDHRSDENSVDELYDEKGFFFRQRRGHLNLRRLEGIDLERLIREVDIDVLQQNIEDITFCEFGENDVHFLTDRQVVKIFRMAQLTIEYLLYSQGKLVGNLSELSKKYNEKKRYICIEFECML